MKNNDLDILGTICKNSTMAYDSTEQVARKCRDKELRDYLRRQMKNYAVNASDSRKKIEENGGVSPKIPFMEKKAAQLGIFMKTAADRSTANIAKLMYNGTNMGIIDIAHTVNRSAHASPETIRLAQTLMSDEEKYADGLRKFL